jgi:enoyl-[acyl-carrier protein] reductase II
MNKLLQLLNISYPMIQGGMGNISPTELCVAVSRSGGLGQVGVGNLPPESVENKLRKVTEELKEKFPFGVNVPISVHPQVEEIMQLIVKYSVPVVSLSAGNPKPWIPFLKEHGITVMVVVATVTQALKAEAAGADIIIGEGFEAAGKNSPKELTTMTLIPQLVRRLKVPIVAAGGIGDGHGLLATLSLGASGVQLGTRLIATQEAHVHNDYQQAILQANDEGTLILGRRYGLVTRVLNTSYAQMIKKAEEEGMSLEDYMTSMDEDSHDRGAIQGLLDQGHVNAGQISGAIQQIPSVAELFEEMMREAKDQLDQLKTWFN